MVVTKHPDTGKAAKVIFVPEMGSNKWKGRTGSSTAVVQNKARDNNCNGASDATIGESFDKVSCEVVPSFILPGGKTFSELQEEAQGGAEESDVDLEVPEKPSVTGSRCHFLI